MNLLKEVLRAINTLLSDEETLYNPRKFEHELLKQLEKIRGLWDKLPSYPRGKNLHKTRNPYSLLVSQTRSLPALTRRVGIVKTLTQ